MRMPTIFSVAHWAPIFACYVMIGSEAIGVDDRSSASQR
jgi:hypothetical protein